MPSSRSFFPDDKPRSWVVAISAGLLGLLMGLIACGATWAEYEIIKNVAVTAFVACWTAFAVCGVVLLVGQVSGRYQNIEPRPWREQVW